jgi:hypothetical protein
MKFIDIKNQDVMLNLSYEEILILNSALNEIINGIAIPEFETRIGASKNEVADINNKIIELLDKMEEKK